MSPVARALVLFVAACGARGAAEPGQGATDRCPATYAAADSLGSCPDDVGAECAYPEGRCHCSSRSYCGGVEPDPGLVEELSKPVWQCEPARTDGCPDQPTGACTEEGKQCVYADCCIETYACTSGVWERERESCPP